MTTLQSAEFRAVLARLEAAAEGDDTLDFPMARLEGGNAQERADLMAAAYLPVSPEAGHLMYALTRSARPATVVEFGTSYGISTLHLAAAVKDNGAGHVVSTELSEVKVAAARANLAAAGLGDVATVLAGDARETLADLPGPIGVVLLDGWKDLCLPVLRLLEDRLAPGAVVLGDDTDLPSLKPYLDYVRDPANGYLSVNFPVGDGMEISCRL
ncbi:class I SAM-dependent methyltransferase [Actinoplanes sp. NPDC051411]|uniref:O-methyltransferase n=1 Tax=Actinoplanes sp. NPDC051411 TaxID=3155522 RepID=UPI00341AD044